MLKGLEEEALDICPDIVLVNGALAVDGQTLLIEKKVAAMIEEAALEHDEEGKEGK
jgi:hypothetical protein